MSDLFGRNGNDNERDDERPRIIFANLRRPSRPILTEAGYKAFSATAFTGWALVALIVWILRVEVSLSKELATSLAHSSVELSALSLAVLGILHELNKEDKWFKLGLFLVSILFAGVVFGGFFLALTWQPAFDLPQQINIVVVAALGLVAIIQIDWKVALRLTRIRWIANVVLPTKVTTVIRRIRLSIPFVLPILLIWLPDLNRVTAIVVLFAGALIALVILMGVTTISLLKSKEKTESEDPFIATLRARYENEIKSLVRLDELKTRTIHALRNLQADKVKRAFEWGMENGIPKMVNIPPEMVEISYIVERLRQMGITEDKRVIESVVDSLVDENTICRESYSGPYWTIPDNEAINDSLTCLGELAFVISANPTYLDSKNEFKVEGYKFAHLKSWLAVRIKMPLFVVGEYVVPRALKQLLNEDHFHLIREEHNYCFVNKRWLVSYGKGEHPLEDAEAQAKQTIEQDGKSYRSKGDEERLIEYYTIDNFLKQFPHTNDGQKLRNYLSDNKIISYSVISTIASILTRK
ncbi:MAG: hypothetical protein ACXV8Q_05825 [Methylobacter sp.]